MPVTLPTQPPDQQALLAQALASAANAIFITDQAGQIVWINDAFSRLSGYSPADTLGRTPGILHSGKQTQSFYTQLWQTIRAGKVWQGEMVDRRKDGSLYTVDEIITPLLDEKGVITHFIAIQHDITRQKQEGQQDRYLARHDSLTNLPNRIHFIEMQQRAISHAMRTRHMFATFFLDLDRFKPINDTLGHQTGDQLLGAVADRLRSAVRRADIVARFGGDKFAILLIDLPDIGIATGLARKLVDAIFRPFVLRGQRVSISASIGIAVYPNDGEDAETLLANADKAMDRAKCDGGNRFCFYDAPDMPA